jgi:DNA-directed RNA polymerase specialized sigma24 family protein
VDDDVLPDGVLYEALRLGSGKALGLLAERHDAPMRRTAALYIPAGPAVDALVLRTWATALPGLDMFTWHCAFRAWLFGILVTAGRAAATGAPARDAGATPDLPTTGAAPAGTGRPSDDGHVPWATLPWSRHGSEAVAAARAAFAAAPLTHREALWLVHAEGWPARDAGDALALTADEFVDLLDAAVTSVLAPVAEALGTSPPSPDDRDAAADALLGALVTDPGGTPRTDLVRALRRWRADRGLTAWHRVRARWRLRRAA